MLILRTVADYNPFSKKYVCDISIKDECENENLLDAIFMDREDYLKAIELILNILDSMKGARHKINEIREVCQKYGVIIKRVD